MKRLITIGLILISFQTFCNIHFITFDNIPNYQSYLTNYEFLVENVGYYNHWTPDWTYDKSKKKLIKELKSYYNIFSKLDMNNFDVNLLLGDIAHYLYNLEEQKYFSIAENHYIKAIEITPDDFRPYWFIGNHYALSAVPDKSIENFYIAQSLLPSNIPAAFWNEFTNASMTANMTSHCIYGMDKAKEILGRPSYIEDDLGEVIRKRLVDVNKDSVYDFKDIWTYSKGDLLSFISRPLGVKLLLDSTWEINFYNYEKFQSFVTIVPPSIKNKIGRSISYTITIIFKVGQPGETLRSFIDQFTSEYPVQREIEFTKKYPNIIATELENSSMYQDIGGAHMNFIGIKREFPEYPGLLLEKPMKLPESKSGKVSYYKPGESKNRFSGSIFYAIILDSCGDIYDDSHKIFKDFFENQLLIE